MKILAFPIGSNNIASSRIRLYSLLGELHFDVIDIVKPNSTLSLFNLNDYDLIYVQKIASDEIVEFCTRARENKIPVIYDIDDDFGCWPNMDEKAMCLIASAITVDSLARKKHLTKEVNTPIHLIPCMIDMAEDPCRSKISFESKGLSTIGTFGNKSSIFSAVPVFDLIDESYNTLAIGPDNIFSNCAAPFKKYMNFALATFVHDLLCADTHVLCHTKEERERKDNNRQIMAMSLGIPVVAGRSPSYEAAFSDLGLEEYCFDNENEINEKLELLQPENVRESVSSHSKNWAWKNYSPSVCASIFKDLATMLVESD